jgi:hypothetical protein
MGLPVYSGHYLVLIPSLKRFNLQHHSVTKKRVMYIQAIGRKLNVRKTMLLAQDGRIVCFIEAVW